MAITSPNAAGAEGSAANGNITLGVPASPANGDIWIAVVHSSDQVTHSMDVAWTQIAQGNGGGTTSHISVWWFRYAGSNPNMVVTHTAGQSPIGGVKGFTGCKASGSPIGQVGVILGGTDASMETNAIVPNIQGSALLVCFGAADDNNATALGGDYVVAWDDSAGGVQNDYQTIAGNPDGMVGLFYDLSIPDTSQNPTVTQAIGDPWATTLVELLAEPVNNTIVGAVAVPVTIAGQMLEGRVLNGAITVSVSVASGMVYTAGGFEIVGNVLVGVTVAGGMVYNKHPSIAGAVAIPITISSPMDYTRNASIIGAVLIPVSPAAALDFTRNASISGSVTVTLAVASGMQFTSGSGAQIVGDVLVELSPGSGMMYTLWQTPQTEFYLLGPPRPWIINRRRRG